MASTTQASYEGTLRKYLQPVFGEIPLRDMNTLSLQKYFSGLGTSDLGGDTVLKIKEVFSAVLGSAVRYDLLIKNPLLEVQIPRAKVVNKKKQKPHITPEEFERLIGIVSEPYGTMVYVAVFTGLRVSELIGLKWEDVQDRALTVDERAPVTAAVEYTQIIPESVRRLVNAVANDVMTSKPETGAPITGRIQ